ncbi:flavin reductase family protein [Eubacterium oxidoreducens]|uniref:NADH-FMN oxidoreductase RutF, flavin reductase (DIM6/NTAB) family n=1 Tax=Eubacterium oxidoreducens TaxID=1732 RepID=A0A1G6AEN5_EUBOX|nr:flavin reductase family protein [Eubacterium oxidoreducens]SDB06842.1 NADH-FMN oxidoreductase RutF, flavin reductase (DIM6/NTAB) family [Eubacterium oxidoreducens]
MQKNIGSVMGLYPTPVTIVGVKGENKVNFLTIAHVGVVEHGHLLVSIDRSHEYSNSIIQKTKQLSVSLVNQKMLTAADYCGIAKGATTDKSTVFPYYFEELKAAPIIENAPVSMACEVIDSIDVGAFTNYILKPVHTYVQEECLNERGKIDYEKADPVLFEFQSAQYLNVGTVIGKAWILGKDYQPN